MCSTQIDWDMVSHPLCCIGRSIWGSHETRCWWHDTKGLKPSPDKTDNLLVRNLEVRWDKLIDISHPKTPRLDRENYQVTILIVEPMYL